ncbi:hypothetical protein [Halomarina litorea]|uniref:hypothetical protein n=1 Tax=Halomarina litorea TaxID=2961595 RepID=UPI0020C3859C|nr:hypothetical protein [Halomarina sp. BCD28]
MNRRFAPVLVLVLTAAALGTFLLADLPVTPDETPTVDTDAPPDELAAQAIAQYDHVDYTYEWSMRVDGERRLLVRGMVDNTDQQALVISHMDPDKNVSLVYVDEREAWHRPADGSWRPMADGGIRPEAPFPGDVVPVDAGRLGGTNVTVVEANASTLVLRVDAPVFSAVTEGHTDLVVERERGVLRRAVQRSPEFEAVVVYEFADVGTTDVERPPGIGDPGLDALLTDLLTYTP